MDIELAVDAMDSRLNRSDGPVLGDGDFRSLSRQSSVAVSVLRWSSTISSQPPMIADELRRQADVFMDLAELQSKLSRDPERPTPR